MLDRCSSRKEDERFSKVWTTCKIKTAKTRIKLIESSECENLTKVYPPNEQWNN